MNPNAGEWKPSAAATEWTPSAPPAAAAAAPPPDSTSNSNDNIDESDPLWQLVLTKICQGDRGRALKLINDPDSLANYPEVEELIAAATDNADDDDDNGMVTGWDKMLNICSMMPQCRHHYKCRHH